ncbi:MAG: filamentous hemagglutinin, partial [Actinobacteria bacterium]|nr:filamentous hemagglutinin [Actinomycetota bacterium]
MTADAQTKQYGSTDPSLTWEITTGSLVGSDQLSGLLTRASGANVGTYAISQGTLDNTNYDITFVGADLTITTKPITVTPAAQTKQYGASDPTFTYTITTGSLELGDSLSGALSRASGTSVGTYAITIGTLANSNYDISVASANLTITTRPITLTADDKTITYGASEPSLTYSVTSGSIVGSDTFSGSLARVSGTDAGTYTISRGTLANSNYAITFVNGTLTINKASQSALTVSTSSVVYGTSTVVGSSGGSGDGAVSYAVTNPGTAGCTLSGSTLSTTGGVGTTCTLTATKAASTNYNQVSSSATTVTVTSRAITISAVAASKQYGQADPTLSYTITSGTLASGDSLTGSLTRTSGENVGTYAIAQGTLGNSNYDITFVPANLTVTGRPITVTASARSKIYGASDPSLGYTITSGSLHGSDTLT